MMMNNPPPPQILFGPDICTALDTIHIKLLIDALISQGKALKWSQL